MALIPLSEILRKIKMGYSLGKDRGKLNHLLFMDDLKLYGRNVNEIDSLIQSVRIFSQGIGMEFGIQKCAMLKIVRGKMVECEGISLPNGEKIRSLEKGQESPIDSMSQKWYRKQTNFHTGFRDGYPV